MGIKKEVWKLIAFQGKKPSVAYAVSNLGNFGVMQKNAKVEVRKFKPQNGGLRYNYKLNGKSKALFIHKEVAKAFVKKPSSRHSLIIRKDHDYLNNKADNLKWVTPEEHKKHVTFSPNAVLSRKKRAIIESKTAKVFDEKTVRQVKKLIWDPKRKLTFKQIAEKFDVSEMQIYRIKSGELWFHVKVENEPLHPKYKENLLNISYQQKKAEREEALKRKRIAKTAKPKASSTKGKQLKRKNNKKVKSKKTSSSKRQR
jgi:hypothetical protein